MQSFESHALTITGDAIGVYLAYPTTSVLRPTYRGHKTLVNHEHTKVGITTKAFVTRENEYMRTFSFELAFFPLLVAPLASLYVMEHAILAEMRRRYPLSGAAREWFHTTARQDIAELVWTMADGF